MRLKLNASSRILAARETVENSIDWLNSYLENSAQLASTYLLASNVVPILQPLIDEVPYVPANKTLYHILGSDDPLEDNISLKSHRVTSYTYATDESEWEDIAEAAGINNNDHWGVVKVVSRVKELTNTKWLHDKVKPYLLQHYANVRFLHNLIESIEGYQWQKEVIAYSDSPIKTKLIKVFE